MLPLTRELRIYEELLCTDGEEAGVSRGETGEYKSPYCM
jgi:hypothetical protein